MSIIKKIEDIWNRASFEEIIAHAQATKAEYEKAEAEYERVFAENGAEEERLRGVARVKRDAFADAEKALNNFIYEGKNFVYNGEKK